MACFHEHCRTCHKGYYGRFRCRLCKKSGLRHGTNCVTLQLLSTIKEMIDEDENDSDFDDVFQCRSVLYDMNNINESLHAEEEKKDKYAYNVKEIEYIKNPIYELRNPLFEKTKNKIVVWELDRPIPDMNEVTSLEDDVSFDELIEECNYLTTNDTHVNNQLLREKIIFIFEKLLRHEPGTVGVPYNDNSLLWIFLENENLEIIKKFYNELMKGLKTSNQYAVEHNVVLSYCTGSHNNTSFLGGREQSKSGLFYIAPYMAKEKASLTACMTILEKSRKEIKIYPSKASDNETKPKERLTKHFLTKVVNKLNAFIELSDYQVAAYLMNMPSIITSEIFQYLKHITL